jgi:hypothetical protein
LPKLALNLKEKTKMTIEARKYKLIDQITHIEDDAVLTALEEVIQKLLENQPTVKDEAQPSLGMYRGVLSEEAANALLQHIEQSRSEWEKDI